MENGWKILLAGMLAAFAAYFQQLMAPIFVLIGVAALDWLSGVGSAWIRGQLSSTIGLIGIIKKLSYGLIVAVGMALDYLIALLGSKFGVQIENTYFVGLLVIIWLVINECISILENTDEMGLPVPSFIMRMLKRLKRHTEETAGEDASPEDM